MARAVIPMFRFLIGTVPDIRDDATNGWAAGFEVFFIGAGAPGGFSRDTFEVHFLDTDTAFQMDNRIRDAARVKAADLGIPDAASMPVISFLPPRRL